MITDTESLVTGDQYRRPTWCESGYLRSNLQGAIITAS